MLFSSSSDDIDDFMEIEVVPYSNEDGYLVVDLEYGFKTVTCLVHELAIEAFEDLDGRQELVWVVHLDGNLLNNNVDNLNWCFL